jgi:hypothetical protein
LLFLLNDAVLHLTPSALTPPVPARRFSRLTLDDVLRLGCEMFAEEPRLQHRCHERAMRLATLIVSKAPEVNAALFAAPFRGCLAEDVRVRLCGADLIVLARLCDRQVGGTLTSTIADQEVWGRLAAA